MYERDILIQIAADCPVAAGVVPESKRSPVPFHVCLFEVISAHPYRFTFLELLGEAHALQNGIAADQVSERDLATLAKKHPCPRASVLPKRYGWGFHVNEDGKLATWGCESAEYKRLSRSKTLQIVTALRSRRESVDHR